MNGGTIFVLFLALGFLVLVVYLSWLSRQPKAPSRDQHPEEERNSDIRPRKSA